MGMKNEKKGFFSRMLSSEHKVFETSMFGISVVLTPVSYTHLTLPTILLV